MEPRLFRLRVVYAMRGRLALLSHLEVTGALERIVRRAGLPFALSQGFSPHMKIAFGSALPVGIGGEREVFDLQLTDYIAPAKVLAALQKAAPADLMPVECAYIEPKAQAASVAYPYSLYEAVYARVLPPAVSWPETVEVVRKKKPKMLVVGDYLVGEPVVDGKCIRFQLESKETGNLRPDVFLEACLPGELPVSVMRVDQGTDPLAVA